MTTRAPVVLKTWNTTFWNKKYESSLVKCLERESILCHEDMIVPFKIKSSLSLFCVFLGIKIAIVKLDDLKVLLLLKQRRPSVCNMRARKTASWERANSMQRSCRHHVATCESSLWNTRTYIDNVLPTLIEQVSLDILRYRDEKKPRIGKGES